MKRILGILGATSVGKTAVAKLIAKTIDAEIISADSMQIYKGLNIGTAKASKEEMNGLQQHMIDIIEPDENFSSFDYGVIAGKKVEEIFLANKTPIVVGGTGFYFDALLYPLSYTNKNNTEIRINLNKELNKYGIDYLYSKLLQIDPESAKTIHPNNVVRVIRALEIYYSTGKKKSDYKIPTESKYPAKLYVLNASRNLLYERINKRVDDMIRLGLVDEVKSLINKYPQNCNSFQAIGYKEIISYLNKECTLDFAIEKIKQNTRNYAKRQLTYFLRFKDAIWIDVNLENPYSTAQEILKDFYYE